VHVAALHEPPVQTRLAQSPAMPHESPAAQVGQVPPPQSVSVSAPFFVPSEHDEAWQTSFVHRRLWQSLAAEHALPAIHFGHVLPQSTSVSFSFCTKSEQLAA
jgi:hypothetical protein